MANGRVKHINDTEFVGVYNQGVLKPKCLPDQLDDESPIRGIATLWAQKEYASENGMLQTSSAQLNGQMNKKYFCLLLHNWFLACNQSLELGLKPVIRRDSQLRISLSGKPDFYKTEAKNKGLLGPTISVVTRLGYDIPELMVIRDAYEHVLRHDSLLPMDSSLRSWMITI